MATRTHRRLIFLAAIVVCIAALFAFAANIYPDVVMATYCETKRWIAAVHPEKLPSQRPRLVDVAPCRGTVQTAQSDIPDRYFPWGVLGCDEREDSFLTAWYSNQEDAR
ncbi:MAG: hypothetical protein ABSG25_03835 [Bryobacteraceae bacterium]